MNGNNTQSNCLGLKTIAYCKKGSKKDVCQDKINIKTFDDGISIIALSDGLGSKSKSDIGAKITVNTAIRTLHELFANCSGDLPDPNILKTSLLGNIKENISQHAGTTDMHQLSEYSCTLLFAVMKDSTVALGQIGDGYIVTRNKKGEAKLVFAPKGNNIEFANDTSTIFSSPRHMQLISGNRENFDYIFLSSDGTDKLINGTWEGRYTPFISKSGQTRSPQEPIFDYMSVLLQDSQQNMLCPNKYPKKLTTALASMLIDNRLDDDVTFACVSANEKGPILNIELLLSAIRDTQSKTFSSPLAHSQPSINTGGSEPGF